jgi:5-methylcytosine-specific restriction enzyme subunit McrC
MICLREHRTQVETLSASELTELVSSRPRLVRVSPRADGRYDLTPGSRVGTVVYPSVCLLIRPKVPLRNIFFLLGYANRVRWADDSFPYAEEPDLLPAIAWLLDREVARVARFGLARDYQEFEDSLTTLRGKLDLTRQIAVRPGRNYPLECRYTEYSEDIPLNRVLKAAHQILLRLRGLDTALGARLRHRSRQLFADVNSASLHAGEIPRLELNHLTEHWEPAVRLSEIVLRSQSLLDHQGAIIGTAFTVDMNILFEKFITRVVEDRLQDSHLELIPQATRRLARQPSLVPGVKAESIFIRPDLLVLFGEKPVAVADAKYKQLLRTNEWEHPDLYQLIAYCVRFRLPKGLLIYAGRRPLTRQRVVNSNLEIQSIGIHLGGTPQDILSEGNAAVDVLLENATAEARTTARMA